MRASDIDVALRPGGIPRTAGNARPLRGLAKSIERKTLMGRVDTNTSVTVGTETTSPDVRDLLAHAGALIASHTGRGGICAGCLEWWARLAPVPCEQARWAQAVRGRFGATDATGLASECAE